MSRIRDRIGPNSGLQGPTADAVADALDAQFDAVEAAVAAFVGELAKIDPRVSDPPLRVALRFLADGIGLSEDPAWTDAEFKYAILARADARASHGLVEEMVRFAQARSPLGDGAVDCQPVSVRAYVAGGLSLSTADQATLVREFLHAIPDVAGLQVIATTVPDAGAVFTFDLGPGFDLGKLAGNLYP